MKGEPSDGRATRGTSAWSLQDEGMSSIVITDLHHNDLI